MKLSLSVIIAIVALACIVPALGAVRSLPMGKLRVPAKDYHSIPVHMRSKYAHFIAERMMNAVERDTSAAPLPSTPLGGNVFPIGIYFIEVTIGTPGQTFKVAVDSGSCTLIVPGANCRGCTSNIVYQPKSSSTSQQITCPNFSYECFECTGGYCGYSNTYQTCNLSNPDQTCTVSGLVFSDVFQVAGLKGSAIPFGTITYQTANFEQFFVIDGVMGYACEQQYAHDTPLAALVNAGLIKNQFSLCFDRSLQGGIFTLGGADPSFYTGSFQYTPFLGSGRGLYSIRMNSLTIGGKSIGVTSSGFGEVVVDTGTNVLLLNDHGFVGFQKTLLSFCSASNNLPGVCGVSTSKSIFAGNCFNMTAAQVASFPTVSLQFPSSSGSGDISVQMPSWTYIVEQTTGSGQFCLGVINTGPGGFTIIGDTTMQPYVVLFDRVNNQLGFAPVNTNTCKYSPSKM